MSDCATQKRIYVGGLYNPVPIEELKILFGRFGQVKNVDIVPHKNLAYIDLQVQKDDQIQKCIFAINSSKWKGNVLKVALAKPEFQQVFKDRLKRDEEFLEKKKIAKELKLKSKAKVVVLLPPRKTSKLAGATDDFVPSNPTGWIKVRGRYVPIVTWKIGRGKGSMVTVDPKNYANNMAQNVLCFLKPLQLNKLVQEIDVEKETELDKKYKTEQFAEVKRWAQAIHRHRESDGKPLEDYAKLIPTKSSNSKDKKIKKDDGINQHFDGDDFDIVGDSFKSDDEEDDGGISSKKSSLKTKVYNKDDEKANMLNIIGSLLSAPNSLTFDGNEDEEDSGDFDDGTISSDSELEEEDGDEEQEVEPDQEQKSGKQQLRANGSTTNKKNQDTSSLHPIPIDPSLSESDSEEPKVVDFLSSEEDESGEMDIIIEDKSSETSISNSNVSKNSDHGDDFEGEFSESDSIDSYISVPPQQPPQRITTSNPDNMLIDEKDDIMIPIKPVSSKQSKKEMAIASQPLPSLEESDRPKRQRNWTADEFEDNKKFAYADLLKEEDEKLFEFMGDRPGEMVTFKFLPDRSAEDSKPPSSFFSALLSNLEKHEPSQARGEKPIKVQETPQILVSQLSLFSSPLTSNQNSNQENGESPSMSSNSHRFVRTAALDRQHQLWQSKRNLQRNVANASHKQAAKRMKSKRL